VRARTEDKFFAILQECWDQSQGFWDRNKALQLLGNEDLIGQLFSWVLASDLRGWHSIAAKELRKSIACHESPPDFWLEELWRHACSSITSDPDEMQHLFSLMHVAKSDSVRNWFAEPLISLCERRIEAYVWLGFEGLEALIQAGGAIHLKEFMPRLIFLGRTLDNPIYRQALVHVLQQSFVDLRGLRTLSSELIKDMVCQNSKPLSSQWIFSQSLSETNIDPKTQGFKPLKQYT
jgi:hypothetical protein